MDKEKQLALLHEQWAGCSRCGLCNTRTNVVFGEGNPNAPILILGGEPGAAEDRAGRPFMGDSGGVLDILLRAAGIDRKSEVYLTNVVACRPFVEMENEKTGRTYRENRPPSTAERLACRERILSTIYIIDPFLIIAMGKTAVQSLIGKTTILSKMRGHVYTMHMPGKHVELRYPVLSMYDPGFLAKSFDYSNTDGVWCQTGRDFRVATEVIDYIFDKYYHVTKDRNAKDADKEED